MEDLFDDFTDDKPARTELDRLVPRRQAMAEAYMGICRGAREKAVLAEADGHGRVAYELSDQVIEAGIRAASVVQRDVCQSLALWCEQRANGLKQSPYKARLAREALTGEEIAEAIYTSRTAPNKTAWGDLSEATSARLADLAGRLLEAIDEMHKPQRKSA